jgi:hypothetical protein
MTTPRIANAAVNMAQSQQRGYPVLSQGALNNMINGQVTGVDLQNAQAAVQLLQRAAAQNPQLTGELVAAQQLVNEISAQLQSEYQSGGYAPNGGSVPNNGYVNNSGWNNGYRNVPVYAPPVYAPPVYGYGYSAPNPPQAFYGHHNNIVYRSTGGSWAPNCCGGGGYGYAGEYMSPGQQMAAIGVGAAVGALVNIFGSRY